jgi:DNA-binding CsgD family transcriptional regulator
MVLAASEFHIDAILFEVITVPSILAELVSQLRLIPSRPILVGIKESGYEVNPIEGIHCVDRSAPVDEFVAVLRGQQVETKAKVEKGLPSEAGRKFSLTEREYQVLLLIASGFTTNEIGKRLRLSPKTIESRRQTLFSKLGVQSQSHAVAVAARSGLLGGIPLPVKAL